MATEWFDGVAWTKDQPTVDGFYWLRILDQRKYSTRVADFGPTVVKVARGYLWIPGYAQESTPDEYARDGAEWAGPLDPPA